MLAGAALEEMREALRLHDIALYLPDADGHPVLRRYVGSAAAEELSFDAEAWQLAIAPARRSSCASPRPGWSRTRSRRPRATG